MMMLGEFIIRARERNRTLSTIVVVVGHHQQQQQESREEIASLFGERRNAGEEISKHFWYKTTRRLALAAFVRAPRETHFSTLSFCWCFHTCEMIGSV